MSFIDWRDELLIREAGCARPTPERPVPYWCPECATQHVSIVDEYWFCSECGNRGICRMEDGQPVYIAVYREPAPGVPTRHPLLRAFGVGLLVGGVLIVAVVLGWIAGGAR